MTILLTGGTGFIGSHTAVELEKQGYRVVLCDNLVNSKQETARRISGLAGHDVPFYPVDCCDREALRRVFAAEKPDAVIHFAGLKAVGESVLKPLLYYRNNIDSALTLLEVMKEFGVRRIIFSSSATVYGVPASCPIDEAMPTGGCSNPYGWTKYMIERILTDAGAADPTLSVALLRYFNPIGAHESGLLLENPNGLPNNLMPYILQVASGRLKLLHVFGDDYKTPDGTGVRDYIHVMDLASGHAAALRYMESRTGVEVFNLGTGTGYSVLDVIRTFEKVNGVRIPYVIDARRPGDIDENYADPGKAERLLHWKAERSLEDMCRDAWNAQKRNAAELPDTMP